MCKLSSSKFFLKKKFILPAKTPCCPPFFIVPFQAEKEGSISAPPRPRLLPITKGRHHVSEIVSPPSSSLPIPLLNSFPSSISLQLSESRNRPTDGCDWLTLSLTPTI